MPELQKKLSDPEFFVEIFVQPGEYYWGESDTRIRTILGSCIAICLWHPQKKIGGMCHYLLPGWSSEQPFTANTAPAKYSEDAMQLFLRDIKKNQTRPEEYQAKIFGGGYMMGNTGEKLSGVGAKNITSAHKILSENGIKIIGENTGENVHRKVFFDLWNGEVWMKKTPYNKEI
ncbi:MAG: chemotaxis protein CheD [Spirochaetia bacterium]|nr:chemotaxis protein CheD [Spirochaetia bacterium]